VAKTGELNVTESELLEALRRAAVDREDTQGAMTSRQLADALEWTRDRVYKELHRLRNAGQLEVHWIPALDVAGRRVRVPGYRLVRDDESQEFDGRNLAK
jgi:hypothetical protein